MIGKVCMITGATSGIGFETARALAQKGAKVIVVGRNPEKSLATVNKIKQETSNDNVEFMIADLSEQKQIHHLADEFKRKYDHLHVLVNNAGATYSKRLETIDGIEMTWAVNYLSQFILTNLLLETIKSSAPARIINITSGIHKNAKIDFDDLQCKQKYSWSRAYGQAKLAVVMFTYELARRLKSTGITVNVVQPGLTATNFGLTSGRAMRIMKRMINLFAPSPEKGAQTSIYLATSFDVENVTGKYFEKCKAVSSSKASYDEAVANSLWQISAKMTGI